MYTILLISKNKFLFQKKVDFVLPSIVLSFIQFCLFAVGSLLVIIYILYFQEQTEVKTTYFELNYRDKETRAIIYATLFIYLALTTVLAC